MKSEHLVGTSIPRFTFDTPTTPGNDFYKLCEGEHPLVMIFLPAFDHPCHPGISDPLPADPAQTARRAAGLRGAFLASHGGKGHAGAEFPFTLICDAPGCCTATLA